MKEITYILALMLILVSCSQKKPKSEVIAQTVNTPIVQKTDTDIPLDTMVNDFILDDTACFSKVLKGKKKVIQSLPYFGECTVFCNEDRSEYFLARINYGGFDRQYDAFWVLDSAAYTLDASVIRLPVRHFVSGARARMGADCSFLKSYTSSPILT